MPIEFDPEWEYYVPSIEWLEAFEDEHIAEKFDGLMPSKYDYRDRNFNFGLRFGRGNPNSYPQLHLGREKKGYKTTLSDFFVCPTCKQYFRPYRSREKYCSMFCVPRPGKKKILPKEDTCRRCHKTFKPLYANHKFCSRKCGSYLGAPQGPSDDKLNEFRRLYMSGATTKMMCAQFGIQLSCLKKWKKKLGLESRKPGRPSGTISPK